MSNETNVASIYITNEDAGYIIHRLDLVKEHKREILHQLELLIKQLKEDNK